MIDNKKSSTLSRRAVIAIRNFSTEHGLDEVAFNHMASVAVTNMYELALNNPELSKLLIPQLLVGKKESIYGVRDTKKTDTKKYEELSQVDRAQVSIK